jgi:hypothetical protein
MSHENVTAGMPAWAACKNCRWWMSMQGERSTQGKCKRSPPTGPDGGFGSWPTTRAHQWCGEFADPSTPKAAAESGVSSEAKP